MRVQDFKGVYDVTAPDELEKILRTRYENGLNAFWLSHGTELYPVLTIHVRGNDAYVWFTSEEGNPGFDSVAEPVPTEPEEVTFLMHEDGERLWISSEFVVSIEIAITAAKDFLIANRLPQSVKWRDLVAECK